MKIEESDEVKLARYHMERVKAESAASVKINYDKGVSIALSIVLSILAISAFAFLAWAITVDPHSERNERGGTHNGTTENSFS